jgi:hypothetical protein
MQSTPASFVRTRHLVLALCAICWNLLPLGAVSAAPINDLCANAIVIPGSGPFPQRTAIVPDIRSATTNGETVYPGCAFGVTRSIWYRFAPTTTAQYTLSTALDTATTLENPVMSVFTSSGGCAGPFVEVDCNDDTGGFNQRAGISRSFSAGTTYYVVIWTGTEPDLQDTGNNYSVELLVTRPDVPANDNCAAALTIPASGPFPYWTTTNDTTRATTTPGIRPGCVTDPEQFPSRELWYRFQPGASGSYIFSTRLDETGTTTPDTAIAIYTIPGGCGGTATQIAGGCNDNGIGSAKFAVDLTLGTQYYIVVWDNSPDPIVGETVINLNVTQPRKPSVITLGATSITSTGLVLHGSVNNNGGTLNPRFWFEWGATTSLGSTSKVTLLFPSTTTETPTNVPVTGYLPNTTYFYEMVATNNLGMTRGGLQTFRFFNERPVVTNPDYRPDSRFFLSFVGHSNHIYSIEGSVNFAEWIHLGLATSAASGTNFQFTSPPNGAAPHRFYRTKLP